MNNVIVARKKSGRFIGAFEVQLYCLFNLYKSQTRVNKQTLNFQFILKLIDSTLVNVIHNLGITTFVFKFCAFYLFIYLQWLMKLPPVPWLSAKMTFLTSFHFQEIYSWGPQSFDFLTHRASVATFRTRTILWRFLFFYFINFFFLFPVLF